MHGCLNYTVLQACEGLESSSDTRSITGCVGFANGAGTCRCRESPTFDSANLNLVLLAFLLPMLSTKMPHQGVDNGEDWWKEQGARKAIEITRSPSYYSAKPSIQETDRGSLKPEDLIAHLLSDDRNAVAGESQEKPGSKSSSHPTANQLKEMTTRRISTLLRDARLRLRQDISKVILSISTGIRPETKAVRIECAIEPLCARVDGL